MRLNGEYETFVRDTSGYGSSMVAGPNGPQPSWACICGKGLGDDKSLVY